MNQVQAGGLQYMDGVLNKKAGARVRWASAFFVATELG